MAIAGPPDHLKNGDAYIYVTSQNKYYRTIVPISAEKGLPYIGHNGDSFQELYNFMTDYGPGDPGYRGGRWWIDSNPNGEMDEFTPISYVLYSGQDTKRCLNNPFFIKLKFKKYKMFCTFIKKCRKNREKEVKKGFLYLLRLFVQRWVFSMSSKTRILTKKMLMKHFLVSIRNGCENERNYI
jgi:hypothetical protein